ncbi:MAG TPA: hypothetical protein VFA18_04335, partial [Gemmataceae bacterium]|nr:hypothetical protein [Gemmataceae bacterium]
TLALVKTVSRTGATAGSVLTGAIRSNAGLRILVQQDQPRGDWGPVRGPFELLDPGENMHTDALTPLVGQVLDAATTLRIVRKAHPMCVNVVNTNILMVEQL